MDRRLLLALTLAACRVSDAATAAAIPRHRGSLPSREASFIRGMGYDPTDVPIAWTTDHVVVAHVERYSSADVFAHTCAGSGFFAVAPTGGAPRALAVGAPACRAVGSMHRESSAWAGDRVVYSAPTRPNGSRLVRLELATGREDSLPTGCGVYLQRPTVAADGGWIAGEGQCRSRDERWGVYVARADGTELREVPSDQPTDDSTSRGWPALSPDGRRLAYVVERGENTDADGGIAVTDVHAGGERVIARGGSPSWSPDGEWIAFVAEGDRGEVRVVRPDGTGERVVYRNTARGSYRRGWGPRPEGVPVSVPVWSPDARSLAISRVFDEGVSVWLIDVATGRLTRLTRPATR